MKDEGIVTRTTSQVDKLFFNLIAKPEVVLVIVLATALTVSNVVTPQDQGDLFDKIVERLSKSPSMKPIADMLSTYKVESVTAAWFVGVYLAVPSAMRAIVIVVAATIILAFDYSMQQAGLVAAATYAFVMVKDTQVRATAFVVAGVYTYFSFSKSG